MKTVKREQLKKGVNEVAPKLPENVVFLAGMRRIKDDQMQVEIAQSRSLAGRQVNVLAALNEGDKRFNSGRTLMRVWVMVNEAGFNTVFGNIAGFNFGEAAELAKGAKADEVVSILHQVETINVGGKNEPAKIVCLETTDIDALPKSIREQLQDENVSDEIKERYILQTGGDKSQHILDPFGNKVYRRYELAYGDRADVLVADKQLASDYAEKLAKGNTKGAVANTLAGVLEA